MQRSRPTLKDVAAKAGVSAATASIVLRGLRDVVIRAATRHRVQAAARALRYRHNALAASLRLGTTDLVAFVVDSLSLPTRAAKLAAAEAALQHEGMRTVFWHTSGLPEVEEKALCDIRSQMPSGLVIGYEVSSRGAALLKQFGDDGIPMVSLEPSEELVCHVVTVNREAVMYTATKHLLELGHRRIGLTGADAFLDLAEGHGRGYVRALKQHRIDPDPGLIFHLGSAGTFECGHEVGQRLLDSPSPPTGLVCSDDEVAIGVMAACRERGVAVPGQLAIVGFDDLPVAAFAGVPLTTIGHPTDEAGRLAAEVLLADIRAEECHPPQIAVLEPELVVRESCGARLARGGEPGPS